MIIGFPFFSTQDLKHVVEDHVRAGRYGEALVTLWYAVEFIHNRPRSVGRVLVSRDMDDLCRLVAHAVDAPPTADVVPTGTVFLLTELSRAGGHIEVLKDYVRLNMFPKPLSIVLTDCFSRADDGIAQEIGAYLGVSVEVVRADNTQDRFFAVVNRLSTRPPQTLILLTHHQDSVGLAAALRCPSPSVVFCHHADHHLCLGATCEEFTHVDLTNLVFKQCRYDFDIRGNLYWPLTISVADVEPRRVTAIPSAGLTTCAAGQPGKFIAGTYRYEYVDIMPRVMAATGGRHIHIGGLLSEQEQAFRANMAKHGVAADRLILIPYVPSVAAALIEHAVDVYLISFPIGGGKSAVEAMAAGIPIAVHACYRSLLLSGAQIAYDGAFVWRDSEHLIDLLTGADGGILREHSVKSRAWYEAHYSEAAVRQAMQAGPDCEDFIPTFTNYNIDHLQKFLDEEKSIYDIQIESQNSLKESQNSLKESQNS
ncbi:MAG: hypothetical protein WCF85_17815, partial [Rhodospirillaceae bacterium]